MKYDGAMLWFRALVLCVVSIGLVGLVLGKAAGAVLFVVLLVALRTMLGLTNSYERRDARGAAKKNQTHGSRR